MCQPWRKQNREPEEPSQGVHAMHEEPASVHREPSPGDRDAEDVQDQQNQVADAYKPPPPELRAEKRSAHQADGETILE